MMKRIFMVFCILVSASVLWAADTPEYLEIRNETGFVVAAVYISSTNSEKWGENQLINEPLTDKATVRISLETVPGPIVDIRARDSEGDTYTLYSVDTTNRIVVFKLTDIDPD